MSTASSLPTQSAFLTYLLRTLSSTARASNTSTSQDHALPDSTKPLLLTLHVLCPHHTLEALDLLDRGLVLRLITKPPISDTTAENRPQKSYYVRSAQTTSSYRPSHLSRDQTGGTSTGTSANTTSNVSSTYYQVHLSAWNCSCPAFAYAAYPSSTAATRVEYPAGGEVGFGGLPSLFVEQVTGQQEAGTSPTAPPVCKHLLACVLAEECPELFGTVVEDTNATRNAGMTSGCIGIREKVVSIEEAAGWAAGGGFT